MDNLRRYSIEVDYKPSCEGQRTEIPERVIEIMKTYSPNQEQRVIFDRKSGKSVLLQARLSPEQLGNLVRDLYLIEEITEVDTNVVRPE
jgi:hypothetical protein